ncbi:hypothetical protein AC1031_004838 [Aphanomyces cochlioides]|nr:hypothetical protein AC1031_004838 [Aphanomyces cochlioides]
MQRRHSGANADQLAQEQITSPRASMPRRNSMGIGMSASESTGRSKLRWRRSTIIAAACFLAFFVLLEVRYQRGCDVSESFSRETSRLGEIALLVLKKVSIPHWLTFTSLVEALLLVNAKGDTDTIAAAKAARESGPSTGRDYHVSTVEIAVDMSAMHEEAFWAIVSEFESHHLHVAYDQKRHTMHVFEKDDTIKNEPPNKYIPTWAIPEPYHEGKPHVVLWFLHLDTSTDPSLATYSIKQVPGALNRKRIFLQQDIIPLNEVEFLGSIVSVPHNSQKVAAQEFAQELHDGISVKHRTQCIREFFRGDPFYGAEWTRYGWLIMFAVTSTLIYKGLRRYVDIYTTPAKRPASSSETDHKVFV